MSTSPLDRRNRRPRVGSGPTLVEQEVKTAVHHLLDLRGLLLQPVVDDSTVDDVVRANLVSAPPCAHLSFSGSTVVFFRLDAVVLVDFRRQNPKCLATVLVLVAAVDENLKPVRPTVKSSYGR